MYVFSESNELRDMYKKRTPGTRGIAEGYSAHVLDAMEILDEYWKTLEPVSIAKCWLKARTLSLGVSKQIRDMYEIAEVEDDSRSCTLAHDYEKMIECIMKLNLSALEGTGDDAVQSGADIRQWLRLEELEEVVEALGNDAAEENADIDSVVRSVISHGKPEKLEDMDKEDPEDDDDSAAEVITKAFPMLVELGHMFAVLE